MKKGKAVVRQDKKESEILRLTKKMEESKRKMFYESVGNDVLLSKEKNRG